MDLFTELGDPQLWDSRPFTRTQTYDESIQRLLFWDFMNREIHVHVLFMPDDTRVRVNASLYDSMWTPLELYCFDWPVFRWSMESMLREIQRQDFSFRKLRHYLRREMYRCMRIASTFDQWQRNMIAKDHACQLVIVNCCDIVELGLHLHRC